MKNNEILHTIRESFGRVVYTHKVHEKEAEIQSSNATKVKRVNILITTLTSGTLVTTLVTNQTLYLWISSILAFLGLAFAIFQLSFEPSVEASKHRRTASQIWKVREQYINLIADTMAEAITIDETQSRRDNLLARLDVIYQNAPQTSHRAYQEAQKALQIEDEMTFTDDEIDKFLPDQLRKSV